MFKGLSVIGDPVSGKDSVVHLLARLVQHASYGSRGELGRTGDGCSHSGR